MKKCLLFIVAFCATITVYSQSVKSLRILGQDQQQKYISISEIDSITHDETNLLQTFWSGGYATSFSLSNIKSISFEDKDVKYSYVENYIDSLDAIFSDEGYAAVFGGFEIPTSTDVTSLERAIYVAKVDLHAGTIDETDATLVVVDSTDVPTQIVSKKGIIRLSQLENGHFCCLYKLDGQDEWTEIDEIDFDLSQAAPKSTRRRSLATGGVSNFTIASVLKALSIVNSLKGCFQSAYNNNLNDLYSNGLGFFGNFMKNDEVSVGAGLVSAGLTKSLGSGLLSILQYAGEKIADGPIKYLGPVRLTIEDVGQTSRKACSITYSVSGLHEYGMANSWLYFELYKGQRRIDTIYLPSENGTVTKTIENLEPGQYGVVLHIKTKKYHWEYTTYPEVKFTIFDLGLDRYEIEDNHSYSNGTVNFKMSIYLKGSEEGLGDIQQFGYYTRYSKSIPDYKQVSHLSTIFDSTPLNHELSIEREGFFEKDRNYSTFEAKATGYYIGAYIVLKNGNIVTIDEQEIEGLIYKQKPRVTTGDKISEEPTSAVVKCKYEFYAFWNAICGIEFGHDGSTQYKTITPTDENETSITLTGLTPNTTYQYRAYFEVKGKKEYGEYKSFKTKKKEIPDPDPVAITGTHYKETTTPATIECTYYHVPSGADCGYFLYEEAKSPSGGEKLGTIEGTKIIPRTGLEPSTTYYYQAYIEYNGKTYLGGEQSFKTLTPIATTGKYSNVTKNSAVVECSYENVPFGAKCYVFLQWEEKGSYQMITYMSSEGLNQKIPCPGLKPSTTYYYTAAISYNGKEFMGEEKSFRTTTPPTPVATTGDYSNVTEASATVFCSYVNVPEGGVCGVEYKWDGKTSQKPVGSGNGTHPITLSGLQPITTYTYCAYIEADGQTYYGGEKKFTTDPPDLSGSWNCTSYTNKGTVYETWTITFNKDGSGCASNGSSTYNDFHWEIGAGGSVNFDFFLIFQSSGLGAYNSRSFQGVVNDLYNPTSISGRGQYNQGNAIVDNYSEFTFVMTR